MTASGCWNIAYLNSHYQSGLKNLLDVAVLQHVEIGKNLHLQHQYENIDEIPFDFVRRRLSVILSREDGSACPHLQRRDRGSFLRLQAL